MKAPCGFFPLASIGGINDSSLLPWAGSLSQVCLRISAWNSWTPCQHWILAPMHRQQTKKKTKINGWNPQKWRWMEDGFFSIVFPFPIEAFSGSMLSMLFVFGFMYGVFRPEKGGLSLSSRGILTEIWYGQVLLAPWFVAEFPHWPQTWGFVGSTNLHYDVEHG